ncbi:nad binding enzyme [Bacillus sp. 179-C3.3 HS]|uniref:nad binding enzyme n=1 Tax=Bacillus sp. 179-C3.3 HS TaxID=3232162 RepID=UPI0039A191FB
METGLIVGADEFFGLSLCEYMIKEGIQVDITFPHAHTEQNKRLLEERMMWLGRNDLIRVIDMQEGKEMYDLIFIQSEEPNHRGEDMKAKQGKFQLLFKAPEEELRDENIPAIVLPHMYGPWTLDEERMHHDDHSFYVDDVAEALLTWAVHTSQRQGMLHYLQVERQIDTQRAEKKIAEWNRHYSSFFDKNQE